MTHDTFLNANKKTIKRIDWNTTNKIMTVLYHDGRMKKTNIAMRCGINYDKCVLYLKWLEKLDFTTNYIEDGFKFIGLNSRGIGFYKKEFELLETNLLS